MSQKEHRKTIAELEAEIQAVLSKLDSACLPAELQPLRYLAAPGFAASVSLRRADGREIRPAADASQWKAGKHMVEISYEPKSVGSADEADEESIQDRRSPFRPVPIKGQSLSSTITQERR